MLRTLAKPFTCLQHCQPNHFSKLLTHKLFSNHISSLLPSTPHFSFCTNSSQQLRKFSQFVTNPELLNTLSSNSMSVMFPIQSVTFPLILDGRDVLARDRTGSGKTLAYTLPVLQRFYLSKINPRSIKNPKFLILCPTRQLVLQVANQIKKLTNQYKVATVYGGASISNQIRELQRGAAIVVATPGRLIDLMEKQAVLFQDLQVVCIDEADTMLQKGFKLEVQAIFKQIKSQASKKTQNLMFSATIPPWVATLTERYLKNGATINMIKEQSARTSMTVQHYALMVKQNERYQTVLRLIQRYNPQNRTIIFTQTKIQANEFIRYFDSDQIVILHGDIPQNVRQINIGKFKKGEKKILIATDVASRGLDIPNVELVIQLSPPENPQPYIHRSGRTGRAGKEGSNITFFDQSNIQDLLRIQKQANIQIKLITDNYNITLWKKQAKFLISQIAQNEQSKEDPFYQLLITEITKKVKPEDAILYFLKQKLGKIPQTTSSITNKKGYITYLAHKRQASVAGIKEVFKGFEIVNLSEEQGELKFDIVWNDFYHFEEAIEKQDAYQLQIIDQNSTYSLKQFNQKYFRRNRNSQRYSNKGNSQRYNSQRNSKYQPRERYQRTEQERYQRTEQERYQRTEQAYQQIQTKNIYLARVNQDISKQQLEEEISKQTGVDRFRLKLISKSGENGDFKFGFIQLQDSKDSLKLLGGRLSVNGFKIQMRPAKER